MGVTQRVVLLQTRATGDAPPCTSHVPYPHHTVVSETDASPCTPHVPYHCCERNRAKNSELGVCSGETPLCSHTHNRFYMPGVGGGGGGSRATAAVATTPNFALSSACCARTVPGRPLRRDTRVLDWANGWSCLWRGHSVGHSNET